MTSSTVAASCITHASHRRTSQITCAPSPCGPAFPASLAGRCSCDYYGHSVAIGLAPAGDPAVRPRRTCRARHRPPTHLLNRPRWAAPRVTEAAPAHGFMPGPDAAPVPGVIPEGAHIHHWRLGFKQSSLGHITRVLRHPPLDASNPPPLSYHPLVPFTFPPRVAGTRARGWGWAGGGAVPPGSAPAVLAAGVSRRIVLPGPSCPRARAGLRSISWGRHRW